jgi:signal recognition particle subunit SRP54
VITVTGKAIKFIGVAEKINGLERFDPERMAGRVLGMGDIVALVEDVSRSLDIDKAQKLAQRVRAGERFDLNDFREQIGQMRKMGGLSGMLDKLPTQFSAAAGQVDPKQAESQLKRVEGIVDSMTPQERSRPEVIKASRKRRIAAGAGVTVQEVNRLLNQFEQMQSMMKQMRKGGLNRLMRGIGSLRGMPGMPRK